MAYLHQLVSRFYGHRSVAWRQRILCAVGHLLWHFPDCRAAVFRKMAPESSMEMGQSYLYHGGCSVWLDAVPGRTYAVCQTVAGEYADLEKGNLPNSYVRGWPAVFFDGCRDFAMWPLTTYVSFLKEAAVPPRGNRCVGCGNYGRNCILCYHAFSQQYLQSIYLFQVLMCA